MVCYRYVFQCISIFIECTQFFRQNHTSYTMESIIRALYILLKTQGPDNVIILGLELVSDVISRQVLKLFTNKFFKYLYA